MYNAISAELETKLKLRAKPLKILNRTKQTGIPHVKALSAI